MNYVCRLANNVPDTYLAKIKVAAGTTLRAGNVILAESLDSAIAGNYEVYVPGTVADITAEEICLVLNGGFETMTDGRRPDGQPDYTQYIFQAGEVVTVVRLNMNNIKMEISKDALELAEGVTVAVGGKLIPVNAKKTLTFEAANVDTTALNYLKVEAKKNFRIGGQFGGQFAETFVVRSAVSAVSTTPSI